MLHVSRLKPNSPITAGIEPLIVVQFQPEVHGYDAYPSDPTGSALKISSVSWMSISSYERFDREGRVFRTYLNLHPEPSPSYWSVCFARVPRGIGQTAEPTLSYWFGSIEASTASRSMQEIGGDARNRLYLSDKPDLSGPSHGSTEAHVLLMTGSELQVCLSETLPYMGLSPEQVPGVIEALLAKCTEGQPAVARLIERIEENRRLYHH